MFGSSDVSAAREPRTTDGTIALLNLQSQIDVYERSAVHGQGAFVELLMLRAHLLGRIKDAEWANELAEAGVRQADADGAAFVTRARVRATFHRFTEALRDLDEAERLGVRHDVADNERATIFQAIGRYADSFVIRRTAADHLSNFETLGALAVLHAESGDTATAEILFDKTRSCYGVVCPFPIAMLDFQRGRMWMTAGDLKQARIWFEAACFRLPDYAPAQGHLAEVDAALGERKAAINRLSEYAVSSDDPDYAAQLARILGENGQPEEAIRWSTLALARYNVLLGSHPAAFADHAAEFFLESGNDPERALELANMNLELRKTPRARELVARAAEAVRLRCHLMTQE
ncbi:hypothetical protein EN852_030035 [Mesorhizobium sp. M2E.F.Ca.ET.209.01.1.1]|uniref:tetratricopeptide repeat protein n=2 Tax=unclassified Mesorhizobium TaxID=325217 RepID=UPI000FDB92DF|nr:hypothetical protein [Mesorhizobium sp. M2E.F.Ca.ET.209.01.1.1]TGS09651.1 hypothetical protein EN852_030035 [Mesorhizobium sp. M2E.F.Ca.ET.209.01.1.1]